jgi:[ribosomal protein S18]-alanine N-acetyltransferase
MKIFPAVTLRPARLDDARSMAGLSRDLIEAGLRWRYTMPRMAAMILDDDSVALVACDAAGIQGFAVMHFGDEWAHLVLLCVRPAQRRCGIGRSLHEWLLASARVAGIRAIQLELRVDNPAALAFYQALEYAETEWVPRYYDGQIAARRMTRVLRDAAP